MSVFIGSEALISSPKSDDWAGIVNFRPGNNETVDINPPRFSWFYTQDPLDCFSDNSIHLFTLQIATDSGFSNIIVEQNTSCNFWNFLEPFEEGNYFWRVAYYDGSENFQGFSSTRVFTVAGSTPEWDRSMLADPVYLAEQSAHPHILFNEANKDDLHTYLTTTGAVHWNTFVNSYANDAIAQSWWPDQYPDFNTYSEDVWIQRLTYVAFVYAMSGESQYEGIAEQLVLLANRFEALNLKFGDEVADRSGSYTEAMAIGYDWCYALLTEPQRAIIRTQLAARCAAEMNINRAWKDVEFGDPTVQYFSIAKRANAHGYLNFINSGIAALSAYGEDEDCREYLDLWLNYLIGVTFPYGFKSTINQGRGYLPADMFESTYALRMHALVNLVFPESAMDTNPFWPAFTDWFDRFLPVGFQQVHEPWGDAGVGGPQYWGGIKVGRLLAGFLGHGRAQRHFANQYAVNGVTPDEDFYSISLQFLYPAPAEVSTAAGNVLYPDGFAVSNSGICNTLAGYKSSVGFAFEARTKGSEGGHSHYNDGSFQLWAYGAPVTDGGAGFNYYAKVSFAHYCLMVNGLGILQPFEKQVVPTYGKFIAWKEDADFLYVAADLTQAYPITDFAYLGNQVPGTYVTLNSHAALSQLQKVQRHIFFVKQKYWVIFDDLEFSEPANFQWVYHVYPALDGISGSSFHYTVQNEDDQDVEVYVAHIHKPSSLTTTNLTGNQVATNPVTGENYYAFYGDTDYRQHAIWVSNTTPAMSWKFMSVVVPVEPGKSAPTITRLDDLTVSVTYDGETTSISFDANNVTADYVINATFSMGDNLTLNKTTNTDPVTSLYLRAPVVDGVPTGDFQYTVENYSGNYPKDISNNYVYAPFYNGAHIVVVEGTKTVEEALAEISPSPGPSPATVEFAGGYMEEWE